MRTVVLSVAAALVFACGGEQYESDPIGTANLAYRIKPASGNYKTYGVAPDYDRSACVIHGGSGQICRFLASVDPYDSMQINIKVGNGFTYLERLYIEPAVDAFCAALTSTVNNGQNTYPWSCNRVTSGENLLIDFAYSGSNSSARKADYVWGTFDNCSSLLSSPPGTYYVCGYSRVYFDPSELNYRIYSYSAADKTAARRDVIYHGLFGGIGIGTDHSLTAGSQVLARELGTPPIAPQFLPAKTVCQLRSWYMLPQDAFFFSLESGYC